MNGYEQAIIGFMAASGFTAWTTIALYGVARITHRIRGQAWWQDASCHQEPHSDATESAQRLARARALNDTLTEATERLTP
jgi:hypothetical protein